MTHELLGTRCVDQVTGFEGTVVGVVIYISGCLQALVAPLVDKDGKMRDSSWIDLQRLRRLDNDKIILHNAVNPGCDKAAPKR